MSLLPGKPLGAVVILLWLSVSVFISITIYQLQKVDELERSLSDKSDHLYEIKNLEKAILRLPRLSVNSWDLSLSGQELERIAKRNGMNNFSITPLANNRFRMNADLIRGDKLIPFIQTLPKYGVELIKADINTLENAEGSVAVELLFTKFNSQN